MERERRPDNTPDMRTGARIGLLEGSTEETMIDRLSVGLAGIATGVAIAALVVAAFALTREAPALPTPTKDEPGVYTKAVVEDAIERHKGEGLEASMSYHNDPANNDGEWYVFIINEEGRTISHHNPYFIGRDPTERVDSTGYYYGEPLLGATEEGRWVDYTLLNPETGAEGKKHTWAKRHDGLIFASGWYER